MPSPQPDPLALRYDQSPSALANTLRAFLTFGRGRRPAPPRLEVTRRGFVPDPAHVAAFLSLCRSPPRNDLHLVYPFALAYPLLMRLLSAAPMPFSMTRVLNTRNVLRAERPIAPREELSLHCRSERWRHAPRGRELDLIIDVVSQGQRVWSGTITYLVRGARSSDADPARVVPRLIPLERPARLATWQVESRDRFRFARVSGDTNGLHYWAWYARRFGFQRDFAQPLRVITSCVDLLPLPADAWPRQLEFHLKGPVYYDRELSLLAAPSGNGQRFELLCAGDDRPCIHGVLEPRIRLGS